MLKNFRVAPDLRSTLYHKINTVTRRGELLYTVSDFKNEDRVLIEISDKDHHYKVAVLHNKWVATTGRVEILVFMHNGDEDEDPWDCMDQVIYKDMGEMQAALYFLFNALADGDHPVLPEFEDDLDFPAAPGEVCHVL